MPALAILRRHGYSETEVRKHSFEWIGETVTEVVKHELREQGMHTLAVATAIGVVFGGEEARSGFSAYMASLGVEMDDDEAYYADSDAKADEAALRQVAQTGLG